eukprot:TRINITY_DN1010_c0_g1_i1.p1 TRINITY_DN1010_c0_g1~~TRINITY_DN1010_c0_g1_i1.p1  ORF type:complete len:823 (+),score=148.97 TRINITY_DN1010_c0_g1_i1:44-2470(+)
MPISLLMPVLLTALQKPWMDPSKSVDSRTQLLLNEMTLDEKAAQLGYSSCSHPASSFPNGVGGCHVASYNPNKTNSFQQYLVNNTRLGIPVSFFSETTHSGGVQGTTIFPMPVSQGATWNKSLVKLIAAANALELRSSGGDQALSPILQVCTDPRFGRMEENFAEDPHLVQEYGVAAVTGLQGEDGLGGASTYLGDPTTKVASQGKHYAMYGSGPKDGYTPMGGGPTLRTTFDIYLRPWREFARAGGRGVMAAHQMIDWIPCHANKKMLTDTLRNRFGLKGGYIGSDNTNIEGLRNYFIGFASSLEDAAQLAMNAGLDQDMPGGVFLDSANLVKQGFISNATLDRAVSNVLRKKFASGIFDYSEPANPSMKPNINSQAHRKLAREAAAQGSVLLMNDGTLPLKGLHKDSKLAVIGPFGGCADLNNTECAARVAMEGGYTPAPSDISRITTIQDGLLNRGFTNVQWEQGSDGGRGGPPACSMQPALDAAESADAVFLTVGTMGCHCCNRCGNGEIGDRTSLDLEGGQIDLLQAVLNITKRRNIPATVILIHGRPITFGYNNSVLENVPAMIATWRSGEEGGNGILDVVFGDVNPSGRLAQAWPRGVGYIHTPVNPWYQTHSSMTGGNYYPNGDGTPMSTLFKFGFGLSYSSFEFSDLKINNSSIPINGLNGTGLANATNALSVTVAVKNTGTVDGSVPVIVTYSKRTNHIVRYMKELGSFSKTFIPAGKTVSVTLPLFLHNLARYDTETQWKDLYGNPTTGAYVVDGGTYTAEVSDCVNMDGVWNDVSCKVLSGSFQVGVDKKIYGIYL